MPKLLTAWTGATLSGFGKLDFIRETVNADGGMAFDVPSWWHSGHTHYAMLSSTGFIGDETACDGGCDVCRNAAVCEACNTCQLCAWWTSRNGITGTCEDPAYGGERKRRMRHDGRCALFESRWAGFDELNRLERRVPVETARVYAAAAEAGVEAFSQEDFDEFCKTVKRLHRCGIITFPKAAKEVERV